MTDRTTAQNHYQLLQVKPTASPQEIRRAYRDLSKLYHPDTTQLAPAVATEKFQILNEAYATLSNPEKRLAYDYSIGISRYAVIQAPTYLNRPASERGKYQKNSAYLDPTDRPLSPGELFALFILGVTFVGCLVLVFAIGWSQGELVLDRPQTETSVVQEQPDPTPASPPTTVNEPSATLLMPSPNPSPPLTAPPIPEPLPSPPSSTQAPVPADQLLPANLSSKII